MNTKNIVLLAGKWDTTSIVYQYLNASFGVNKVIIEEPVSKKEFLKKRAKKMGWFKVGGQVLFSLLIAKPLARLSHKRIEEILNLYGLRNEPIPEQKRINVSSVNATETINTLISLNPSLVIVHGTRIISKKVLSSVTCPIINIHAGITPLYRGSHGAYWALVNEDKENCGVTVHLVDSGIDTGGIIAQEIIPITAKDNFTTYPYLQLGVGLQLLKNYLDKEERKLLQKNRTTAPSMLWHHPTLWGYAKMRLLKGIK